MRVSLVMGAAAAILLAGCAVDPYAYGADYGGQSRYNNNYGRSYGGVDASQTATFGEVYLDSGFDQDPYRVSVTSGGSIDASDVASGCVGMVATAPDFQLTYDAGGLPLTFGVHGDDDTTLMINGPDGRWTCDDDSGGNNEPLITFRNPQSGVYDVWVGAYGGNSASAELYVTELGGDNGGGGYRSNNYNNNNRNNNGNRNNFYDNNRGNNNYNNNRGNNYNNSSGYPDSSLNATYGDVYLDSGFDNDPYTVSIASGGGYDASGLGGQCQGMIASAPDFELTYDAGSLPLIISVDSDDDTTLVINGPDGRWYCDDDGGSYGTNPMVRFNRPQSGTYDIWVGSYGGNGGSAELNISEVSSR